MDVIEPQGFTRTCVFGSVYAVHVGRLIRRLREEIPGLTQGELARKAGIHKTTLNQIERAKRTPDASTLRKLAPHLNVPVGDLLNPVSQQSVEAHDAVPADVSRSAVREVLLEIIEDLHAALIRRTTSRGQTATPRDGKSDGTDPGGKIR